MGFRPAPNIKGRVFVPEEGAPTRKKHTCPDCFECQQCGEDRCRVCRASEITATGVQPACSERPCGKKEKEPA